MPGTRASASSETWFQEMFGFRERHYDETKSNLECVGGELTSKKNGKSYEVGDFEVLPLEVLRYRLEKAVNQADSSFWTAGGLAFDNIIGDPRELHLDPANAGAVFQVSSLFNCLETTIDGQGPDAGVTSYASRQQQGPACAMACPAATVFRNYYYDGTGQFNHELDALAQLGKFVKNKEEQYWVMNRGYCTPKMHTRLAKLSKQILDDPQFEKDIEAKVAVGVHWDTEVYGGNHNVCQVYCSALAISKMKQRPASDWVGIATAILEAAFDATLTAAAILAANRGARQKVFVTAVGAGELGNRRNWIVDALTKAMCIHVENPLDVCLVHYAEITSEYVRLQEGREHVIAVGGAPLSATMQISSLKDTEAHKELYAMEGTAPSDLIAAAFALFDSNGDGVIDQREFLHILQSIDEDFFTARVCNILFSEADCDNSGSIHYSELIKWLCEEDEELVNVIAQRVSHFSSQHKLS